jgi:hypothetical protein
MTTPASGEGIEIIGRHKLFEWPLQLTKLTVEVDGQPYQGQWGHPRFLAAPPGEHRVKVFFRYFGTVRGETETVVQVAPGQVTRLEYRTPVIVVAAPGELKTVG